MKTAAASHSRFGVLSFLVAITHFALSLALVRIVFVSSPSMWRIIGLFVGAASLLASIGWPIGYVVNGRRGAVNVTILLLLFLLVATWLMLPTLLSNIRDSAPA